MLINLVSIHPTASTQSVPLANAFLKSYALKCDVEINLVDFFIDQNVTMCTAQLISPSPVAIGFSMYVWNRDLCCIIAADIRRKYPDIRLFCGGPEVTADPESVVNLDIFDFAITGEGEIPFLLYCQTVLEGRDYATIPGIVLPGACTPASYPITDLDTIPSPFLTGVLDSQAYPGILWQLSRGCTFNCDFCFDSRGIGDVRYFSFARLKAELQHFSSSGVTQVFVLDSTFNLNPKRAKKILRMIVNHAPNIHFHFEIRNEFIDTEMATLFAQVSCSLQIGLQSSDQTVLKQVGRSFNKSDFTSKVGLLNESGAVFGFDLIYGLPGDTLKGFRQSLDYALSLYPNHLDIFPLAVLPGTRLSSHGVELNLHWLTTPPYTLMESGHFSATDLAKASELATACDIFYTRGKAVAWFNALTVLLGIKPSELIQQFSNWLIERSGTGRKESDFNDDDVFEMQQLFLKVLLRSKRVCRYLPLVLDLAHYHRHYSEVLTSPSTDNCVEIQTVNFEESSCFELAPTARLVSFTYEISEILDCGEPHFCWMYENLAPSGSHAVIYLNNGIVCTEQLAPSYIHILEQIPTSNRSCLVTTGLDSEEIDDFIRFALQEGIIIKT